MKKMVSMKRMIIGFLNMLGYKISKKKKVMTQTDVYPSTYADISEEVKNIYRECLPYTMISLERIDAIVSSIDYICKNNIRGDIVECGVWRGGAMYAAAKALILRKCFDRKIFLFDVFDTNVWGTTTNETIYDKDYLGKTATDSINDGSFKKENYTYQLEDVKKLLVSTGFPLKNIIFKVGRVENTLPTDEIDKIALLRLDTDWYESTKHELIHLYPQLIKGGVLLIDDYGFWQGCRKAVDEYIIENNLQILLHRTDYTGRSAIKL